MEPLHFQPWVRSLVWGGRRLVDEWGRAATTPPPWAESWELSDHPYHSSRLASSRTETGAAPAPAVTLGELLARHGAEMLGPTWTAGQRFPWIVKLLDVQDRLSVQVHPDAHAVQELGLTEGSKSECWLVLDASPASRIWAGFQPGVTAKDVQQALHTGHIVDYLYSFTPHPGDFLFLPAGTVHAAGDGVLLLEISENSDATFRLYDWDRAARSGQRRPLHPLEAQHCLRWPQEPVRPHALPGFTAQPAEPGRWPLRTTGPFQLDWWVATTPFQLPQTNVLQVFYVVKGHGWLHTTRGQEELRPGQCWLIPAALAPTACRPEPFLGLFWCTVPVPCRSESSPHPKSA